MAITDSQKVDYLFKKIGYSVAKTDMSNVKSPSNESISSPLIVRGGSIWTQSDVIPNAIPVSNSSVVALYNDSLTSTVQTVNDGTASTNRTWKTNLTDWIDASFGSTYQVKVYLATTGNAAPQTYGTQLFADGSGSSDEWFFDYASGVLNFIGNALPSGSFTGKSIFISGARYVGSKGLGNLGNVSFNGNISADEIYEAGYRVLTTNSNIQVNGDVIGYGTYSNVYVQLPDTGAVAGTYGAADDEYADRIPKITVDSKGRITNIANVTLTQVGNVNFNDTTISTVGNVTVSASGNIILDAQGAGVVIMQGTDAVQLPTGDSGTRPNNPQVGYTRFNTDAGAIEYWDGTTWTTPGFSTVTSETINPDGTANTYTLTSNTTTYGIFVSINGTVQQPVTAYNVYSNNQIQFTEVPLSSDVIEVRHFASGITITALQYGNSKVETTTTAIEVTGNLVPTANLTYNLGSETLWWKDLYLSGGTIYLGGLAITNNNGVLTSTVDGNPTTLQASDPVDLQDVVTLNYLNTQLSSLDSTIIQADDTSVQIIDDGVDAGNIVIAVDGSNVAKVGSDKIDLYRNVVVTGNISANVFTYPNGQSILDNITSAWQANAGAQAGQIVTANTAMKGYVDSVTTAWTANAGAQAGTLATIQTNYANLSGATFTGAVSAPSLTLSSAPLEITSGGTGATTTSGVGGALDNLLPSGEQTGYVLSTSGVGSYSWVAPTTGGTTVGQSLTTQRQANAIVSNTTVITLAGISYTPGAGQLRVYINGVRQFPSAYTETSNVSYTLSANVVSGDTVFTEIDQFSSFNNYANLTYASNIGNISASGLTVQSAIENLENNKAPLASPVFSGNVTTSGNIIAAGVTYANGVSILSAVYANLGAVSGSLATLTSNAGVQSGAIYTLQNAGYITGITSGMVTTALGYTPLSAVPNSSTQISSLGVGTAASGTTGEIRATDNITAYYSSDARLKENVRDISNALDKVSAIGGKLFDWTDEYLESHGGKDDYFLPKQSFGVIAQDVEQVLPEAVRIREDGYMAVDYEKMCALAFQAIKELRQQVEELQQQLNSK